MNLPVSATFTFYSIKTTFTRCSLMATATACYIKGSYCVVLYFTTRAQHTTDICSIDQQSMVAQLTQWLN